MALSDYDLLAFDQNGKSCNGSFIVDGEIILEIYKTHLCIMDEKMWKENRTSFTKPIIATINEGDVTIGRISVNAKRFKDSNAIYFYANYSEYKNNKFKHYYFAGIGCYGYYSKIKEYLEYKNINTDYEYASAGGRNYDPQTNEILEEWIDVICLYKKDGSVEEIPIDKEFGQLTVWVGIQDSDIQVLSSLLNEGIENEGDDFKKWVESIDWQSAKRMNPGDYFILSKLGIDDAFNKSATNIDDKTYEPLLMKALKDKEEK